MTIEELTQYKKELKKKNNKIYYEKVKEQHKEKMKQYYHENKYQYIKINLFNDNGELNRNFIKDYDEAINKNKDDIKIKINCNKK